MLDQARSQGSVPGAQPRHPALSPENGGEGDVGDDKPARGWVLYDGQCGFCSTFVRRVKHVIARRGFDAAPLQMPWVRERTGLDEATLIRDIRLLLNDGRLISGADAYLYVMWRIWWSVPAAALFSLPGFHWAFSRAYRWVATNRGRISRACGLTPPPPREAAGQSSRSSS
jgi:predicted DCC family thiol-disulfide oxidoreductase YuxK